MSLDQGEVVALAGIARYHRRVEAAGGLRQLEAGAMLDDKYRIERLLAVGGMGAVYVGTHIKLRKRVAIKVLNPEISSPAMVERFNREAITASQIGHEGIAQVTDIGTSTQGEPFLVMEYLEGESLANRLKAVGPLPIDVACEIGCSILAPLEAAHRAGIVHRDLKPDNVFMVRQSRGEQVKLLDFGISRSQGTEGEFRLTTTGLVLGTPYYMSPEQARGDTQIGTAADLYAFGVIMYEMLVGTVPILGDNYNQLMYRVMTGEYARPREKRPELPEELERIILQAMALDPKQRPASAAQLEQMLLRFCGPSFRESMERITSPVFKQSSPQLPGASMNLNPGTGTDRTVLATPPGAAPKKSRAMLIVLGLGLVAGLGIGAAVLMGRSGATPTAAQQSTPPPAQVTPKVTPPAPPPTEPAVAPPATTGGKLEPATPPAVATITLRFVVEPKQAAITLDGTSVVDGEITVPRDQASHTLTITAPSFATHTEKITFDESQKLSFVLPRVSTARPTGKDPPTGKDRRTDRIDTQSPYK